MGTGSLKAQAQDGGKAGRGPRSSASSVAAQREGGGDSVGAARERGAVGLVQLRNKMRST